MAKKNNAPAPIEEKTVWPIEFDKLKFKTLKGGEISVSKLNETLGDILDMSLVGVKGRRLAEKIFDGGKVELNAEERIVLISFLNSDKCQLMSFVVSALLDVLEA